MATSSAMQLFPARVRIADENGFATPEFLRALTAIGSTVGGMVGEGGVDVWAPLLGDQGQGGTMLPDIAVQTQPSDDMGELIVQPLPMREAFPVGFVFISMVATNPSDPAILGYGTWVALGARTLVGYAAGDPDFGVGGGTGGVRTVSIPNHGTHEHQVDCNVGVTTAAVQSGTGATVVTGVTPLAVMSFGENVSLAHTDAATGLSAIKTLPPYLTVYMFQRTA